MTQKLTIKESKFTREYLKTGNGTQSALQAYDTNNPTVAGSIASENLKKPHISQTIEEALRKKNLTLDTISENVGSLAVSKPEKVSAETVLKANIELLKLLRAYPDKKSYSLNLSVKGKIKDMSFSEAKQQLEDLNSTLKGLVDSEDDIDTTPTIEPITVSE